MHITNILVLHPCYPVWRWACGREA